MKNQTRGFTLIELLVVVLIVGILAAVAVPQYQKAVEKSRLAEVWANLNALHKAAATMEMTTGLDVWGEENAPKLNELDVELTGFSSCHLVSGNSMCWTACPSVGWRNCFYEVAGTGVRRFGFDKNNNYIDLSISRDGKRSCSASKGVCNQLGMCAANETSCDLD